MLGCVRKIIACDKEPEAQLNVLHVSADRGRKPEVLSNNEPALLQLPPTFPVYMVCSIV